MPASNKVQPVLSELIQAPSEKVGNGSHTRARSPARIDSNRQKKLMKRQVHARSNSERKTELGGAYLVILRMLAMFRKV